MKKIVITGGSGRFGTVLKNQVSKYLMFFPSKKELDILVSRRSCIEFYVFDRFHNLF